MAAYEIDRIFFTKEQIEKRAADVGRQITEDYAGKEIFLVGILTGCVMWLAELMKWIDLDAAIDFMAVSSYGSATRSSGIVKINKDLNTDIGGKHVLIVEDIVDSGVTLDYLCKYLGGHNPASLKICAMLDKPSGRRVEIGVDYLGFTAPDAYLVGYGLDANHKFRNLSYIAGVKEV